MDWKSILALGGWILALIQFIFNYSESKSKNKNELLEKTLGYFERGTQSRSIGISLIEGIWLKEKTNLNVILPVLVSQAYFLLNEAVNYAQEKRNLIRILHLIEKCLLYVKDNDFERCEILEALGLSLSSEKGIKLSEPMIRIWFEKFSNKGDELLEQYK